MSKALERQAQQVLDLMSISARTAPKSGGVDDIVIIEVPKKERLAIVRTMVAIGRRKAENQSNKKVAAAIHTSWASDAETLRKSDGLLLIGVHGKKPFGVNCGGCGYASCAEFTRRAQVHTKGILSGPYCVFKIWDFGIAAGSAVKTASMLNVDNRMMYRIGAAVLPAQLVRLTRARTKDVAVSPIVGIPLSITGKNIYFDRFDKLAAAKLLQEYFKKR